MTRRRRTLKRIESPGHARYLTFSCYHRLTLFANPAMRDAFVEQLISTQKQLSFALYAWVIMPNHVHLLVMPDLPQVTVERLLRSLKRPLAANVLARWRVLQAPILNRIIDARGAAHFWQLGGGYDRNIVSAGELFEKIDYIHANPIRARLVKRATDWKWSSVRRHENMTDDGPRSDPLPI